MPDIDKPTRSEDEYFMRLELERRRKWAQERAKELAADEKEKLKQAHWMKCPKCGMDLEEVALQGVKVDSCGNCGGMWLDAGELEMLSKPENKDLFGKVMSIFR